MPVLLITLRRVPPLAAGFRRLSLHGGRGHNSKLAAAKVCRLKLHFCSFMSVIEAEKVHFALQFPKGRERESER